MNIELDHPTLSHLLGYLTEEKWADAIRGNNVNNDIAWEYKTNDIMAVCLMRSKKSLICPMPTTTNI